MSCLAFLLYKSFSVVTEGLPSYLWTSNSKGSLAPLVFCVEQRQRSHLGSHPTERGRERPRGEGCRAEDLHWLPG